jgi:hypothetical protein
MREYSSFELLLKEGRIQGEVLQAQRTLLRLGRMRFGPPPPVKEATLTAIEDTDRLNRMIDVILTAVSWDALLAIQ